MIDIAVFDEHNLVLQGIAGLLSEINDLRVIFVCNNRSVLTEKLKTRKIHILILNLHEISARNLNLIIQLKMISPNLRILIMSVIEGEEIVLQAIRAGARGFLGKDSSINDLTEAIYTLRNGHDYFSKSITHLVLNRYISGIRDDGSSEKDEINQLSSRQIEILKLMGESYSNHEIAERLFISVRTVETHKNHIMQKLNLRSTVDMIKFGIKNNIIDI